jgi:hypothetical protein
MLGNRTRLVFQFDVLHVPWFREIETDRLAQGLTQLVHIGASSETARQLKNFGPQLFARLVVDAHGIHLSGHYSPPPFSPAWRIIAIASPIG